MSFRVIVLSLALDKIVLRERWWLEKMTKNLLFLAESVHPKRKDDGPDQNLKSSDGHEDEAAAGK